MQTQEQTTGLQTQSVEKNGVLDTVLDATQLAMLRPEFVQMRLENETIMAECRAHPRDYEAIKRELKSQLDAFPELASQCIYNKPVGRDGGTMKFARGLSIRAAELLAEAYGYCRVRSDVSPLDESSVKVEATFTDYQRGRVWQDGGILSRRYKGRDGKMVVTPEDRFYNVVVKAEASKRIREATLRSVNAGLKAWFEDQCEKLIDSLLDDKTLDKIVGNFSSKGVTVEQLEQLLGRPKAMGWTKEDRKTLIGVWNAVKDGETSIAEILSKEEPQGDADANKARADALKEKIKGKPPESPPANPAKAEEAAQPIPGYPNAPGYAPSPLDSPSNLTEEQMRSDEDFTEIRDKIELMKSPAERQVIADLIWNNPNFARKQREDLGELLREKVTKLPPEPVKGKKQREF